jgi:hypothetical protein
MAARAARLVRRQSAHRADADRDARRRATRPASARSTRLMALFNAAALMAMNPEPAGATIYSDGRDLVLI